MMLWTVLKHFFNSAGKKGCASLWTRLKDSDSAKPNILYTAVLPTVVPQKSKTMVIMLISIMSSDSLLLSPVFQQEGSVSMNRSVYAVAFYYSEIDLSSNMEQWTTITHNKEWHWSNT